MMLCTRRSLPHGCYARLPPAALAILERRLADPIPYRDGCGSGEDRGGGPSVEIEAAVHVQAKRAVVPS